MAIFSKSFLILLVMLIPLSGCGSDIEAIRKLKDPAKLFEIAKNPENMDAAAAAIKTLRDLGQEEMLKELAIKSPDQDIRKRAARALGEVADLVFVYQQTKHKDELGNDLSWRWDDDLTSLSDEALAIVAQHHSIDKTKAQAFLKIKAPYNTVEVVRIWSNQKKYLSGELKEAIEKYMAERSKKAGKEDQTYLALLAISRAMPNPKRAAYILKGISDPKLLEMILFSGQGEAVKNEVIEKLNDQKLLCAVVEKLPASKLAYSAVRKIQDQKCLERIALDDKTHYLARAEAIGKVANQEVFRELAEGDKSTFIRRNAINRLQDQEVIWRIAKEDKNQEVRLYAINKLRNLQRLYYLAHNSPDRKIVRAACKTIGAYVKDGKFRGVSTRSDVPYGILSALLHESEVIGHYGKTKLIANIRYDKAQYGALGSAGCTKRREFVKLAILKGKKKLLFRKYAGAEFPRKVTNCYTLSAHIDIKEIFTTLMAPLDQATRDRLSKKYL